ncbi:MAG: dipeptidase [Oscillospiraceae bacterium]|jgi:membrane dipeptidase|nr:dipeptidase [Oscillospiraceae bacterium]
MLWRLNFVQKNTLKLFDAHCDTLSKDGKLQTARRGQFAAYTQVYAIWGDRHCGYKNRFIPQLEKYRNAGSPGLLAVEGAHLLDCSLANLELAAEEGVRLLNFTWNNANLLSGTCAEEPFRGLSELGRKFAAKCAELRVLVDVSHLSEAGFWDVAAVSRMLNVPFVASHSNSKALCDCPRNLTDSQYKAIAKSGGVTGVNLHSGFLAAGGTASVADVTTHICRFLELDENAVGLGTDFDGGITPPEGLETVESLVRLYEALEKTAGEKLADAVFYDNWARVLQ